MSVHGYREGDAFGNYRDADDTSAKRKNSPIWPPEEDLKHERFFFASYETVCISSEKVVDTHYAVASNKSIVKHLGDDHDMHRDICEIQPTESITLAPAI